jgi:hypothetical protein
MTLRWSLVGLALVASACGGASATTAGPSDLVVLPATFGRHLMVVEACEDKRLFFPGSDDLSGNVALVFHQTRTVSTTNNVRWESSTFQGMVARCPDHIVSRLAAEAAKGGAP